jgi:hypothetical protein
MPYEVYIGYVTDAAQKTRREIAAGEPLTMEIRDLDTFERLVVRAVVAEPPARVDDGDDLWVLDWVENRQPVPWSIRILEELDDDAADTSRSDVTDADKAEMAREAVKYGGRKYRGSDLPEASGGDEAKKYYENIVAKRKTN